MRPPRALGSTLAPDAADIMRIRSVQWLARAHLCPRANRRGPEPPAPMPNSQPRPRPPCGTPRDGRATSRPCCALCLQGLGPGRRGRCLRARIPQPLRKWILQVRSCRHLGASRPPSRQVRLKDSTEPGAQEPPCRGPPDARLPRVLPGGAPAPRQRRQAIGRSHAGRDDSSGARLVAAGARAALRSAPLCCTATSPSPTQLQGSPGPDDTPENSPAQRPRLNSSAPQLSGWQSKVGSASHDPHLAGPWGPSWTCKRAHQACRERRPALPLLHRRTPLPRTSQTPRCPTAPWTPPSPTPDGPRVPSRGSWARPLRTSSSRRRRAPLPLPTSRAHCPGEALQRHGRPHWEQHCGTASRQSCVCQTAIHTPNALRPLQERGLGRLHAAVRHKWHEPAGSPGSPAPARGLLSAFSGPKGHFPGSGALQEVHAPRLPRGRGRPH